MPEIKKTIYVSKNGVAEVMLGTFARESDKVINERGMKRFIKNAIPEDAIKVTITLDVIFV